MLKRIGFRGRLFLILLTFSLVPAVVLSGAWAATSWTVMQFGGSSAAWERTAASGAQVVSIARQRRLGIADSATVQVHEQNLREGQLRAGQAGFVLRQLAIVFALGAFVSLAFLLLLSSRVAGHLSRNLSRPLQELVRWTEHIARGEPIPPGTVTRGAPEFELLRERMRAMSAELDRGRAAELEAGRLAALRETARQVAHELKNPLTPIRFAVERLRRDAPAALHETIDVLETESKRLEELARSFSQFGRLPEGPSAPVDLGELARYTARSSVPPTIPVEIAVDENVPLIDGHHDALARAVSNVMLNAVEACRDGGSIAVDVKRVARNGTLAVALSVRDTGCGIPAARLAKIWDPYVTYKAGGTGLGLAIARQTVHAHRGDVNAESEPGKGTIISFVFPVPSAASGKA